MEEYVYFIYWKYLHIPIQICLHYLLSCQKSLKRCFRVIVLIFRFWCTANCADHWSKLVHSRWRTRALHLKQIIASSVKYPVVQATAAYALIVPLYVTEMYNVPITPMKGLAKFIKRSFENWHFAVKSLLLLILIENSCSLNIKSSKRKKKFVRRSAFQVKTFHVFSKLSSW